MPAEGKRPRRSQRSGQSCPVRTAELCTCRELGSSRVAVLLLLSSARFAGEEDVSPGDVLTQEVGVGAEGGAGERTTGQRRA